DLPAPCRGAGAPDQAGEEAARDRRGAAPPLRRDDARGAAPRPEVGRGGERRGGGPPPRSGRGNRSRFLGELGIETRARRPAEPDDPVYAALKQWRLRRATAGALPPSGVFPNSTLAEIAGRRPRDLSELSAVPGVGPAKLERYGSEVLNVLNAA